MKPLTETQVDRQTRILSYGLIVMTLTHTMTHSFQNIHTALFPVLRDEFMLTNQQIGIIAAIPNLCQALLTIPAGLLSDKIGSKKMLLLAMAVACAGAIMASYTNSPTMLIVAVSLLYINTTVYHPASYSFVSRSFKPRERSKALGIQGAGGTLGMAIGPISLAVLIYFGFQWRQVYLFWFFPLLLGIAMILRIKDEPTEDVVLTDAEKTDQGQSSSLLSASLIFFMVFSGVRMIAAGMTNSFLNVYLVETQGWNFEFASLILGGSYIMGIIAAPAGGFLAARFGDKKWTLMVLAASYACYIAAFLVGGVLPFTLLFLGHGFFNFLGMASNSSIMAKLSPGKQRGLGFALYFLPGSVMGAVAPIMAAFIADGFGMYTIFMASFAAYVVAILVLKFGVKVE
ncbi:MFS transporter [Candidatus Bathyarchaeota archaeon]|nr:MFS transporter [Candidatus Bathyarchaeota archaeon]